VVIGAGRTAEEIGRAFSNTKVITSGGNKVIHEIPNEPSIVVATPGAEPLIEGGGKYGAAVLVDTWSLLTRADLRATEDVLAKWMHVSTLVNSGAKGGEVVIVADPSLRVVQHLIRWDPVGAAEAELADRREVRLPPAVAMAAIDGAAQSLDAFIDSADLPEHAEILGPVDLPPGVKLPGEYDDQEHGPAQRMLIRTPLGPRGQLGHALKAAQVRRATRKDTLPLRVQIDPIRVG
jgi:primosomal protein N' (replication factor Y)